MSGSDAPIPTTPTTLTPPATAAAEVGDVVVCRDPRYREDLKLPDEFGLVVEARKDRAKVFFPSIGGEPWIPVGMLARVRTPAGARDVPHWMQRAWFLARSVDALLLEVAHVGADGCALRVFHGQVDLARLDLLRERLGDELRYYTLEPAGLHKLQSAIAFQARERTDPPLPLAPDEPPEA